MKNKELKKELIKNNSYREYRDQRRAYYLNGMYEEMENINYFHKNGDQFTKDELLACQQLRHTRTEQVKKIKNHITFWIMNNYDVFFLTFTYDDKKRRKEIKAETLKKYVLKHLTDFDDFIINIDYGKDNERLHFHVVAAIKKGTKKYQFKNEKKQKHNGKWYTYGKLETETLKAYENKIGFYDCEKVKESDKDVTKLSKYIDKLSLHSIKVKQSYCSTKKGTEFQKWQEYNQGVNLEYKKVLNRHRAIFINDYIRANKKYNYLLSSENKVKIDYELLNEKRNQQEKKEYKRLKQILNVLEHKQDYKQNIFDL